MQEHTGAVADAVVSAFTRFFFAPGVMSASTFEWALSPDMKAHARAEFAQYSADGVMGGDKCRELLSASQLSQADLARIWQLSDRDQDAALSESEFLLARFLVYARQQGQAVPESLPASLLASAGDDPYAVLSPARHAQFRATFATHQQNGKVTGAQARPLLAKSGLSDDELARVWALSDADGDGALTEQEYVCALHLALTLRDTKTSLPRTLPPGLVRALAQAPTSVVGGTNSQALVLAAPPPAPELVVDASLFELPPSTAAPVRDSAIPPPAPDEDLVVAFGVSDTPIAPYSSAPDIARVASDIRDPDTGLAVLQQSEPELVQLQRLLERHEQLQSQLGQRLQIVEEQRRTLDAALQQLNQRANLSAQRAQAGAQELQSLQSELQHLVGEVQNLSQSIQISEGTEDRAKQIEALQLERTRIQQAISAIVPEGQTLIAQLQSLTQPPRSEIPAPVGNTAEDRERRPRASQDFSDLSYKKEKKGKKKGAGSKKSK